MNIKKIILFILMLFGINSYSADIILLKNHELHAFKSNKENTYQVMKGFTNYSISTNGTFAAQKNNSLYIGILKKSAAKIFSEKLKKVDNIILNKYDKFCIAPNGKLLVKYYFDNKKITTSFKFYEIKKNKQLKLIKEYNVDILAYCPAFSPDGEKIAFYGRESNMLETHLCLIDIKNQKYNIITPLSKFTRLSGGQSAPLQWNKNGKYIIFEGRFINEIKSIFSIIRLSDKKIISTHGIWYDEKYICQLSLNKSKIINLKIIPVNYLFTKQNNNNVSLSLNIKANFINYFISNSDISHYLFLSDNKRQNYIFNGNNKSLKTLDKIDFLPIKIFIIDFDNQTVENTL